MRYRSSICPVLCTLAASLILLIAPFAGAQEIASLEHDALDGRSNSLVQVDADTYALAYRGADDDGFIKTFTISADGTTITEVASLEHDTGTVADNSLVQVDPDTYLLAYRGPDDDGFIKTFTISADGTTITEVAALEHDTTEGWYNCLVAVDADTYALAYTGTDYDGFIKTFTVPSDGSTITEVASLEHDLVNSWPDSFIAVDADSFVLTYRGNSSSGVIKTFSISADGTAITEAASLVHEANGDHDSLIKVDVDTFALAFNSGLGTITTFTIPADGSTITEVASLVHEAVEAGEYNSFVQVDVDTFALAYSGGAGRIKTFTISADGTSISQASALTHDPGDGNHNSLVHVAGDTYALAFADASQAGFIKTFNITDTVPVELQSFVAE